MIAHFSLVELLDTENCIRLRDSRDLCPSRTDVQSCRTLIFAGSPAPPHIVPAIRLVYSQDLESKKQSEDLWVVSVEEES